MVAVYFYSDCENFYLFEYYTSENIVKNFYINIFWLTMEAFIAGEILLTLGRKKKEKV